MARTRVRTRYPGVYYTVLDGGERSYGATYEARPDWRTGARRTMRQEGFGTEREARSWRDAGLAERDGPVLDATVITLGQFWSFWLDGKRGDLAPRSVEFYERYLRWSGPLAARPVQSLTHLMIAEQMRTLAPEKAAASVRGWLTCLKSVLAAAVDADVLAKSPAARVKGPSMPSKPTPAWTVDELRRVLVATADDERWGPVWRFLAETWVRIGELGGLSWGDVDLDGATVTIRHTLGRDGQLGATKTKAVRVLPLNAGTVAVLRAHGDRRRIECAVRGEAWGAATAVFVTRAGNRIRESAAQQRLAVVCDRVGVRRIGPHGIRHTGATLAYHSGVIDEVTLSKRLGHASLTITMNRYVKPDADRARKAADDFAALLGVG